MSWEDYEALLRAHRARYPLMEAQDCVKLLYQSEFGPRHLGEDLDRLINGIAEEWKTVPENALPIQAGKNWRRPLPVSAADRVHFVQRLRGCLPD